MKNIALSALLVSCLALALFGLAVTPALASPQTDQALAKCRSFEKLTPAQLAKTAAANHVTVSWIKSQCYQLEHMSELEQDPNYLRSACNGFARMSSAQLTTLARANKTTVAQIKHDCYVIAHPSGGEQSPRTEAGASDSSNDTSGDSSNQCSCTTTQVCVRSGPGYTCEDPSSSNNQCAVSTDCLQNPVRGLSNCIGGRCT